MKYITRVCLSMYKVNMTVADSFNGSGCGPNYEHDEEHNEKHDEGDYPQLNFNGGISLDNLNTHGVFKILRDIPDKSRLAQSLLNEHEKLKSSEDSKIPGTKNVQFDAWNAKVKKYIENTPFKLHSNPTVSTIKPKSLFQKINELMKTHPELQLYIDKHGDLSSFKDRNKWNRDVIKYCHDKKIDIGPKPVRTAKETNKVNAKAHHLKNFSVEEHDHYLKISYKKHDHHKPTPVAKVHDHHKPTTVASVDHYPRDSMGRIITQDGLARVAKGDHYPRDSMGRIIVQDGLSRR